MTVNAQRAFGRFGVAVLCGLGAALFMALTLLYPPWLKVECDRYMVLYFSEQREIHTKAFAGFDNLFSGRKRERTWTPPNPPAGTPFTSVEYNVWWTLLVAEWTAIVVAAVLAYKQVTQSVEAAAPAEASGGLVAGVAERPAARAK